MFRAVRLRELRGRSPVAQDSSGLGMTLKGLYYLGQCIRGIPAVIIGEHDNFFLFDKRKKSIARDGNAP